MDLIISYFIPLEMNKTDSHLESRDVQVEGWLVHLRWHRNATRKASIRLLWQCSLEHRTDWQLQKPSQNPPSWRKQQKLLQLPFHALRHQGLAMDNRADWRESFFFTWSLVILVTPSPLPTASSQLVAVSWFISYSSINYIITSGFVDPSRLPPSL